MWWDAWSDNGAPIYGVTYDVYRSELPGREGSTPYESGLGSFFSDSVPYGKTYYYQVAVVAGGVEGPRSAELAAPNPKP
jgi:hypothetical protein